MNDRLRIMIASSTYAPARNGQAVFTTNLAEGLAARGHKVLVVMDSAQRQSLRTIRNGVEVVELPSIGLNIFHADINFTPFPAQYVQRLIESFQPDIVHIQDHYPVCRAVLHTAINLGIKTVGSNHFIPENLAPYIPVYSIGKSSIDWILWHWMLETYGHLDAISAQSCVAADILSRQGLDMPVSAISCGLDVNRFKPDVNIDRRIYQQRYGIDHEKTIFLFLGRIDGEKRIDLLIKAMQLLPRDDIQLVIAGKGRAEAKLHKMAAELCQNHKIVFTGFIPDADLPGLLNSVDVFVMPSDAELLSISTLEAMASGLPVLVANALALPELVRQGENGYCFTSCDVDDLVNKMSLITNQSKQWPKMGEVSREIAELHSLEHTIDEFEQLYMELLGQKHILVEPRRSEVTV
jgi:1,2-diacylglycerol 3-alpha-glucosyltransferase